jgi:PAS domain S-box-containing protein
VAAGGLLEPAAIAQLVVDRARDLLQVDSAMLAWWYPEREELRILADNHAELPLRRSYLGKGAIGVTFERAEPVVIEDFPAWEYSTTAASRRGDRSVLSVPLLVQDRAVGCLRVESNTPVHFSQSDIDLLTLMAAQVAPAIAAARLSEQGRQQGEVFRALHELAIAAGGVLDWRPLAQFVVEKAVALLSARGAGIALWDDTAQTLRMVAWTGEDDGFASKEIKPGQGTIGAAFDSRKPVVVDDYTEWAPAIDWVKKAGRISVASVPLLVQDRAIGTLTVSSEQRRHFEAEEVQLLTLLASAVAPALEVGRLHDDLGMANRQFRAIFETSQTGLFRCDGGGGVIEANPAAAAMFGYDSPEAMVGMSRKALVDYGVVTEAEREDVREKMRALRAGVTSNYRVLRRGVRRDGSWFWADATVCLVRDAEGAEDFYYVIVDDITQRLQAEEHLRDSLVTLRRRNSERRRLLARLVRVQEEERRLIAAGIHDDTLQVLANVGFQLERLRRRVDDGGQLEVLDHLERSLSMAVERLRKLVFDLRPHALDEEGVVPALREFLGEMRTDSGIATRLTNRLVDEPVGEVRVAIYRIAREALNNVRKHARATRAYVLLEERDEGYLVEVRDNGVGISLLPEASRPGHLGMASMRERALQLGGWWRIEVPAGGGTRLRFWLPKDPSAAEPNAEASL